MTSWNLTEALTEQCRNCSNWPRTSDKFCRKCGTRREAGVTGESMRETAPLQAGEGASQSISSRSISRFQHHVVRTTGPLHLNRTGGFAVAVLIHIPVAADCAALSDRSLFVRERGFQPIDYLSSAPQKRRKKHRKESFGCALKGHWILAGKPPVTRRTRSARPGGRRTELHQRYFSS
jgi:hypothetical protein